jgi:predicted transcriptional regulator
VIRIQLHLTDEQDRKLKALARVRGRSRAELIREAIELLFREGEVTQDPLVKLIGAAGRAGRTDVSDNHDKLLYAAEPRRSRWQRKSS